MATKKSSPLKKSELGSSSKKKTVSKKTASVSKNTNAPVKKSSVVKKEVKPISIEETKLITKSIENDRKSLKSTSRSVDILKDAIQTAKAKQASKEDTAKATYSKNDLVKKSEPKSEIEEIKKEVKIEKAKEEIDKKSSFENKKEEVKIVKDKPIIIEEKKEIIEPKEIYVAKESKIEEKKEEVKTYTPLADKKPVTPYSMPNTRVEERKSKKSSLPIIIIILIIAAGVFFATRFMSPKKDNVVVTENPENTMATNETVSTNALAYTDTNTMATNNTLEAAPSIEAPKVAEETNKTVVLETPPKPPVEPVTPKVPEAPITTPSVMVSGANKIYMIKWRDTLEKVAESELGDIRRWPTIYALNETVIVTPDNYKFGDKVNIPDNRKTVEQMTDAEKRALYEDYMKVAASYQRAGKTSLAEQVKVRAKSIYPNY